MFKKILKYPVIISIIFAIFMYFFLNITRNLFGGNSIPEIIFIILVILYFIFIIGLSIYKFIQTKNKLEKTFHLLLIIGIIVVTIFESEFIFDKYSVWVGLSWAIYIFKVFIVTGIYAFIDFVITLYKNTLNKD